MCLCPAGKERLHDRDRGSSRTRCSSETGLFRNQVRRTVPSGVSSDLSPRVLFAVHGVTSVSNYFYIVNACQCL